MPTLLMRLAGPLQSWGTDSKFEIRRTESFPTKSGVIGMIAAALGRKRNDDISDLSKLQFGVRVDQPGTVLMDFHTAITQKGTSYITKRYYLSDAVFLAGIFSDNEKKLEEIQSALLSPVYPLYLGRRSCVPDPDMRLAIENKPLLEALEQTEFMGNQNNPEESENTFIYIDEEEGAKGSFRLRDVPISYDIRHRKHGDRMVQIHKVPLENTKKIAEHDAFGEVSE